MPETFEIVEVESDFNTWTAKKGPAAGQEFRSYKVKAKDPKGEESLFEINRKPNSGPPPLGAVEAERQPGNGNFPDKLKLTPQGRSGGSSGAKDEYWQKKEQRDIESQARQGRAHAQDMALRYCQIVGKDPGAVESLSEVLGPVIDWFHADVQRFPRGADGGAADSLSNQSNGAAVTSERVGFASKNQKDFFDRLLKGSGCNSNQVESINRFTEQLPTERVAKAIDGLNDKDQDLADKTVAALLRESDAFARLQSDIPYDPNA